MDLEIEDVKPDLSLFAEFFNNIDEGDIENLSAFDLSTLIVPKHRRDDGGDQNDDYEQGYRDGYLDASKANNKRGANYNYWSPNQSAPSQNDWVAQETTSWKSSKSAPNNDSLRKFRLTPAVSKSSKSIIVCFKNSVNGGSAAFKKKSNHLTPTQLSSVSSHLNSLSKPKLPSLNNAQKLKSYTNTIEENDSYVEKKLIVTRRSVAQSLANIQRTENDDRDHATDNCNEIVLDENVSDNLNLVSSVESISELKNLRGSEIIPVKKDDDVDRQNSDDEGTIPCSDVSELSETDAADVKNELDESFEATSATKNLKCRSAVSKAKNMPQRCDLCFRIFTSAGRLLQHMRTHSVELKLNGSEIVEELVTNDNNDTETDAGIGIPVAENPEDATAQSEYANNVVESNGFADACHEDSHSHGCPICNMTFRTKGYLRLHIAKIHETDASRTVSDTSHYSRPHSCLMCDKTFVTKRHVYLHLVRVHKIDAAEPGARPHCCTICNKMFKTKSDVHHHVVRVHGTEQLKCDVCPKVFSTKFKLYRHRKFMHTNVSVDQLRQRYLCQQCDARFCTPQGLKDHVIRHAGLRPYGCKECNSRFTTQSGAYEHARKHSSEQKFQCENCSKRFTWLKGLKRHQLGCFAPDHVGASTADVLTEACEVCGKRFKTEGRLKIHRRQHTDERPYPCSQCPKTFTCAEHLNGHRRKQHGLLKWTCEVCPKKFSTRSRLHNHMRVHSDERPYACKLCSASFKSLLALKDHNNRHAGIKPHACTYCPGRFTTHAEMAEHLRVHNNLREYVCETCGRSYNRKKHLWVHRTVHTGEKRYACSRCGKFFRRSMQLRIHMRSHTGEQPYHCKVCDRRFAQSGRYKSHLLTHTGEKPFQCSMCEWAFCRKDKLQDHQRRVHKTNTVPLKVDGESLNDTVLFKGDLELARDL